MAETERRQRDWFAPLTTLVTVVVAVWSLYYSGVQADVARKTFEMTFNEAHAGLQKDLADLQKQVAAGAADKNLADFLVRLADLQAKLAEAERRTEVNPAVADLQHQMAELQVALGQWKKDLERKDREIAALRSAPPAMSGARPLTASLLTSGTTPPMLSHEFVLPPPRVSPLNSLRVAPPVPSPTDDSFVGSAQTVLQAIAALFRKHTGASIYLMIAGLFALAKIFGKK